MTDKEAINILKELPDRITGIIMPMDISYDYKEALEIAIKALEERPKGEWIESDKLREGCYIYSHCKEISCCQGSFCPDCGADMRGENKVIDDDKTN